MTTETTQDELSEPVPEYTVQAGLAGASGATGPEQPQEEEG